MFTRSKSTKRNPAPVLVPISIAIATFIVGAGLIEFVSPDIELATHSKDKPTPITAEDLSKNGPPLDNWHVLISGYTLAHFDVDILRESSMLLTCDVLPEPTSRSSGRSICLSSSVESMDEAKAIAGGKLIDGYVRPDSKRLCIAHVGSDRLYFKLFLFGFSGIAIPLMGMRVLYVGMKVRFNR